MCDCITEVDHKLAEKNTQIAKALVFGSSEVRLMIATEVREKKRGARAATLFATYCPFCGNAYSKRD